MTNYGYIRVSTQDQASNFSLGNQTQRLLQENIFTENIFCDIASGKTHDRPQLQELLTKVVSGDSIFVVRFDRFSRNFKEGMTLIAHLQQKNVALIDLGCPINTKDPFMCTFTQIIFLYLAQLELTNREARQREGIKAALALDASNKGKKNAKLKYPGRATVITNKMLNEIVDFHKNNTHLPKKHKLLQKHFEISKSTYYKALAILKEQKRLNLTDSVAFLQEETHS